MNIFITRLKVLLRSKSIIFWTLIFPIILATFFNLAFSNILSSEKFKPINIGIVNNNNYKNLSNFNNIINIISKNNKDQIFNVTYFDNEKKVKESLQDNKITGYYLVNDKINIVVKNSGINQTIMKYIVDNYYQNYSIFNNINKFKTNELKKDLITQLSNNNNHFEQVSVSNVNVTILYFYSLLGMVCLYAAFFGMSAIVETEANMSKKAARLSVAATNKLKNLLILLLAGFIVQFVEILIFIAYLLFILNIDFGNQIPLVILISFVGSLAGLSMGTLIGVSNKLNENMKNALVLSIIMFLSFLSGLMIETIKYFISTNAPIIDKINPVSMITNGLYSLYYYNDLKIYFNCIFSLLIFSIIMIIISYFFIRRKKYDSI